MRYDAIIIGGGFAGLAAATYLGRARVRTRVYDTGAPRNRFAARSHGFLGSDGRAPHAILADARAQLAAYPSVEVTGTGVAAISGADHGFRVRATDGTDARADRVVLAFGLHDELPAVPGVAERWGISVIHCPYCHGYEFADRPLGVLWRTAMSAHQARLVAQWGPTTLFLDGHDLEAADRATLAAAGIAIEPAPVRAVTGEGTALAQIALADGTRHPLAALYVAPVSHLAQPFAADLGCTIDTGPMGPIVRTDADRLTSVAGVYAAGDIARAPHSVAWAVADGVTAGTALHRALVFG